MGHKFLIRTDQRSLRSLTQQSLQIPEQQSWLHKLLGYDFTTEYKPGKDNLAADALSRSFFMVWSQPNMEILPVLHATITEDTKLNNIRELCCKGTLPHPNYSTYDEPLYWNGRLVIPRKHDLVQQILHEFHTSPLGGHSGVARIVTRIAAQFQL